MLKQQLLSMGIFLLGAATVIGGTTALTHEPAAPEVPANMPALNGVPGTNDPSATLVTTPAVPVVRSDDDDEEEDDDDDYRAPSTVTAPASVPTTATPSTPAATPSVTSYTLAQVAGHATAASCWTAVNGSVYDVTVWIKQHPGGAQTITGMCGKDASASFDNQHGGQRRPEQELASFKIGTLK